MTRLASISLVFLAATALTGCKEDDPMGTPDAPPRDADTTDAPVDAPPADGNPACMPLATDYTPRVNNSADDMWPVCVSDQDQYVNVDPSVSTIARIAAFERIAARLFIPTAPDQQAFTDSVMDYLIDQGLESRVARREDEHYPAATNANGQTVACNDASMTDERRSMFPDRCIGPVWLAPFVRGTLPTGATGFALGINSADPLQRRLAAAQIEAGLLRFLYLSIYKEAVTCGGMTSARDCDSSWAYYGGGEQRTGGLGFARYIRGIETLTHDRIFDGILAVRCWRNLDDPAVPTDDAMFAQLRTRALAQLDRGAIHGLALILRARVVALQTATGDDARVHWEMIRNLGPALLREVGTRDSSRAQLLATQFALTDVTQVDESAILGALDAVFVCP